MALTGDFNNNPVADVLALIRQGENSALVRSRSLQGLAYMGVLLDEHKNESAVCDCELTAPGGSVRLFAIAANEELVVAKKAKEYLERR